MRILLDFDDTLMDTHTRHPGHRMGVPEQGALFAVRYLYRQGHELIVFTGRKVENPKIYQTVQDWLDYFGFPYHAITNIKPTEYDLIIDNRAVRYDTWEHVMVQVQHLTPPSFPV